MGKDPGEAFENGLNIRDWVAAGLPPALTLDVNHGYKKPEGITHMAELQMLLSKYPVTIEATRDRAMIRFDAGFKNRGIRQRIHDSFYKDDDLHWYFRLYHPDDVITGENCLLPVNGES